MAVKKATKKAAKKAPKSASKPIHISIDEGFTLDELVSKISAKVKKIQNDHRKFGFAQITVNKHLP